MIFRVLFPFIFFMTSFCFAADEIAYEPSSEILEAREWFKDSKFGLFIHWGVYSVLGNGEWVMEHQEMNVNDYETLPDKFDPVRFRSSKMGGHGQKGRYEIHHHHQQTSRWFRHVGLPCVRLEHRQANSL